MQRKTVKRASKLSEREAENEGMVVYSNSQLFNVDLSPSPQREHDFDMRQTHAGRLGRH